MDIFTDYAKWKAENRDFIHTLIFNKSQTISRFTSVIAVVDFFYQQSLKRKLSDDEQLFFETGFDYIYDGFYMIQTILDFQFQKDDRKMESCAKTINLLLYATDFLSELENHQIAKTDLQPLLDFIENVNHFLDQKQNVPDVYFPLLNDIVNPIFERNQIEFQSIESIFYEIALEYGIYHEDDEQVMRNIFQKIETK